MLRKLASSARSRPVTALAAVYLFLVVFASAAAPVLAPYQPNELNYDALYQGPSSAHLLGTDELGRDLLSRLLFGGRISLVGVAEALIVYLLIGVVLGLVAGVAGGVIDVVIVWIADVSFGIPQIVVVLAVLAIFANSSSAAMLALGVLAGPGLAVMVRGATQAVRQELYVAAALISGLNPRQIAVRHILPQIAGPIIVQTSLFAGVRSYSRQAWTFSASARNRRPRAGERWLRRRRSTLRRTRGWWFRLASPLRLRSPLLV
jgi:peptide/nickel transport system permease protein